MKDICAACSICDFMPPQKRLRQLSFQDEGAPILILDDTNGNPTEALRVAKLLVGEGIPFTYTTTIRCTQKIHQVSVESYGKALQHCAVWTHLLTDNRMAILATEHGLQQMRVNQGIKAGGIFKSTKWGLVLCIPPLHSMTNQEIQHYTTLTHRVLATTGLLAKAPSAVT